MPESKTPTGRGSTAAIVRAAQPAVTVLIVGRILAVAFAALAVAPAASAFSKTELRLPMPDGVEVAATLYQPDGAAPAGGWPAVIMAHGLGGTRTSMNVLAEQAFADQGYVVLTFDQRGHGESGGLFGAVDAAQLADVAVLLEDRLPKLAPVDPRRIGAWGISLGGGVALRSAAEGEPFAAVVVAETWTNLYTALVPQGLSKSGAVFQFLSAVPQQRIAPALLAVKDDALASRNLAALRAFSDARSSAHLLSRGIPPTLILQGRRDFAFDLDEGVTAYLRLRGPKRLYIGDFGHSPSTFPGADHAVVMQRSREWFDRFLKGTPNGIDRAPRIELAPDPWRGRAAAFRNLPATRPFTVFLSGRNTIGWNGRVVRSFLAGPALETFGAPEVEVRIPSARNWGHLVAVLSAVLPGGRELVVSQGGSSLSRRTRGALRFRLISQATSIPRGARLKLTLGATSMAQDPANLLYIVNVPESARITIGRATLRMPVLRMRVSR